LGKNKADMSSMTKRERVMRTVRFEETDRVPLYDLMRNDAIIEHYTGQKLTVELGEWLTGVAIGRTLDMARSTHGPQKRQKVRWDNGVVLQQERWTQWIVERPFHDMSSLVEWIKGEIKRTEAEVFDRAYVEGFRKSIHERLAAFAAGDLTGRNDPTVYVPISGVGLTRVYWIPGMEMFSYLTVDYPDLLDEWLEARNQAELRRVAVIADPELFPVVLPYDDIAHKTGLLFSPGWLRHYWLPRLRRLVDAWHTRDTVCLFHSDGNLWAFMDDLVSTGIDGLNPLEVTAGMSVKEVRQRYPHLFLAGGIDVSQLLVNGSPAEVRAVCQQAITDTAGHGYFLGSTTELGQGVRLENVIAMFETAWGTARKQRQ
jgi:uroporphyrinogen decarboxylase